jgi:hypothetical protein
MAQQLVGKLPDRYLAEPRVQLGTYFELDIGTFDRGGEQPAYSTGKHEGNGGVAKATRAPLAPTLTVDVTIPKQYIYEVLIFDLERNYDLVAAVEIVSPANKDRPDNRHLFVAKRVTLLQKDVCISIVDLVTARRFNLYTELLGLLGRKDPSMKLKPPPIYAATCRKRQVGRKTKLDTWAKPFVVGRPLPTLPIWLTESLTVSLDPEASYEEACRVLRVP